LWWVLGSPGITTIGENVSVGGQLTVSGNVGIGTSSPGQKIHIYGSSGSQRVKIESAGTTSSDQASLQLVAGDKSWISWVSGDSDQLRFFSSTLNGNVMTLTSSGNVGIGTTGPAYKLDIAGALRLQPSSAPTGANGVIYYDSTANKFKCYEGGVWKDCISAGGIGGSGTTNYLAKWTGSTTLGNSLIYDNGTNVGIGTTSPGAKLHVASGLIETGARSVKQGLSFVDSCGTTRVTSVHNGIWAPDYSTGCGDEWFIGVQDRDGGEASTLVIGMWNDWNDHIALMPSGNVGIGTTSPAYKLDVSGDLRVTGQAYLGIQRVSYYCGYSYGCRVTCPSGTRVLGGGCYGSYTSYYYAPVRNYPDSDTSWYCYNGSYANYWTAYAICARIQP